MDDHIFELVQRMLRVLNDEDVERVLTWLDTCTGGGEEYAYFCQAYELQRPEAAGKFFGSPPKDEPRRTCDHRPDASVEGFARGEEKR